MEVAHPDIRRSAYPPKATKATAGEPVAQRPGPEGREMVQAASVSASKTPTDETVSSPAAGYSRRDDKTDAQRRSWRALSALVGRKGERDASSVFAPAKAHVSARRGVGLVSRGRPIGTTPTRTAWRAGGLSQKGAF